jgi:hypothetical protein
MNGNLLKIYLNPHQIVKKHFIDYSMFSTDLFFYL